MEVNEKCDVYSFGVLALEVIMGKRLGDLILFLIIILTIINSNINCPRYTIEEHFGPMSQTS